MNSSMSNGPVIPAGLEEALDKLIFSTWDQAFLSTPCGQEGKRQVLCGRYQAALQFSLPWLRREIDLASARVVEIGCGSGSSTAALAQNCREVHGFDIDERAVAAARARCQAHGLGNVKVDTVLDTGLLDAVRATAPADVYVLYAVLEHQTWSERLETLQTLWSLLPPGCWLAVLETPNRLVWSDRHSSQVDFHHLLPDELAFAYLDRCPQNAYRFAMNQALRDQRGAGDAGMQRIRWGLGASFHEFQLALEDNLLELVWADGTEREMTDFFPDELDDKLLRRFFEARVPDVPIGFSRAVLNVLLRRPRSTEDRMFARRRNEERR